MQLLSLGNLQVCQMAKDAKAKGLGKGIPMRLMQGICTKITLDGLLRGKITIMFKINKLSNPF